MATTTLYELIRDDLFAAFRSSAVATQAGVLSATWASTTLPYVECGDGRPKHVNMGRLPHVEFFFESDSMLERAADGGEYEANVSVRVTVPNIANGSARQLAQRVLLACVKAARADAGEAEGDTVIDQIADTSVGQSITATFTCYRTYNASEQGLIL